MNNFHYDILLFDADDTILDFKAAEYDGIRSLFSNHGVPTDDATIALYEEINHSLWKSFELGQIKRDEILYKRFELLGESLHLSLNARKMDTDYQLELSKGHKTISGAKELLERLQKTHDLYIVTNGVASTQHSRLTASGLLPYFKDIFVSEAIGYQKPRIEFFDHVFSHIGPFRKDKVLLIGDTLSSDILGGQNAGIDTCWYNPHHKESVPSITCTYEIHSLPDLLPLV